MLWELHRKEGTLSEGLVACGSWHSGLWPQSLPLSFVASPFPPARPPGKAAGRSGQAPGPALRGLQRPGEHQEANSGETDSGTL